MCHSVEMYMPEASRRATEERIREGHAAALAREQRVVETVFAFAAWVRRRLGRAPGEGLTQERMEHG